MKSTTASHLPVTIPARETGVTSSGSSDPRSLSPAVTSVARYSPPINVEIIRNSVSIIAPIFRRAEGSDMSILTMRVGRDTAGATPRAIRRRSPMVRLYDPITLRTCATATASLMVLES